MPGPERPSSPPPKAGGAPPSLPRETCGSSKVAVVLKLAMAGLMFLRPDFGIRLHHEVARRSGDAVFVRAVVHHRSHTAEIVVRRWRCGGPLESGGFPGIVGGLLTLFHAPEKVDEKD